MSSRYSIDVLDDFSVDVYRLQPTSPEGMSEEELDEMGEDWDIFGVVSVLNLSETVA